MNIIKYICGVMCLLLSATSCNVDTMPYDGKDGEKLSPDDLTGLTLGNYRLLKNDGGLAENGYRFGAYGGDDLSISGSTSDALMQILDYRRNIRSTRTEYAYEFCYRISVQCNIAIAFAESLGDARSEKETILMGENYYLRALSYFTTVNMFGQQYVNDPSKNLGIVLKLSKDIEDFPAQRSTVEQTYKQIESDLLNAIKFMTIPTGSKTEAKKANYASKEAAEALLARVYLYMERWEDAQKLADNVIKSERYTLLKGDNFAKYPQFVPEENTETIFAVRRTIDKDKDDSNQPGGMYCRINNVGWAEIYASSRHMELLELHPEDLRSKFIDKQFIDENDLWFIYTRPKAGTVHYEYVTVNVKKEADGTYKIIKNKNASGVEIDHAYTDDLIRVEDHILGQRFYATEKVGSVKRTGRIERKVALKNDYPQYYVNKASYQQQRTHLWSYLISRLGEVYLIRAEANAMLGNEQAALDDVNELRKRAGIPVWTPSLLAAATNDNGDPKTIHDVVEEERQLELAFEGHRRYDVFRRRHTLDKRYPGGHTAGAVATVRLEIPWNDPAVCEYLPQRQLDAYPHTLVQNP